MKPDLIKASIRDVCIFFHCDQPSKEVKTGEQIGGGYGCCGCTGASANYGKPNGTKIKRKKSLKINKL